MKRIRLPVVATGRYARSPILRKRPIWTAARNEIGTVTKLWSTEAGTNPMAASTTDWMAMVQRSECGTTCSTRPDLMCDASTHARDERQQRPRVGQRRGELPIGHMDRGEDDV